MVILGIETSCDETALSLIDAEGAKDAPRFNIIGTSLYSQTKVHAEYGGVFPNLARREHAANLIPLLSKLLTDYRVDIEDMHLYEISPDQKSKLREIFKKEPELLNDFLEFIPKFQRPHIDALAVTVGPGLEPALWVGVNFAEALGLIWDMPVIPVNHMEGHIASVLATAHAKVEFPALALLISGGHTELVYAKDWGSYEILGATKDDAVGEAFDKVARMLGLPYPGGPEISKLAALSRTKTSTPNVKLPRPMMHTDDFHFSFSGLKTAVLYTAKKLAKLGDEEKEHIAHEFENSVADVLVEKTKRALLSHDVRTFVVGGGVVANSYIRERFQKLMEEFPETALLFPTTALATDNAVMIAIAAYLNYLGKGQNAYAQILKAEGNLSLGRR